MEEGVLGGHADCGLPLLDFIPVVNILCSGLAQLVVFHQFLGAADAEIQLSIEQEFNLREIEPAIRLRLRLRAEGVDQVW